MSTGLTPERVFEHWSQVVEADPRSFNRFAGRYKWSLEGEQGGSWLFDCVSKQARVIKESRDSADFEIQLTCDNFLSLARGELNPQLGFLEKQLRVSGKTKYVLRFNLLLDSLLQKTSFSEP